MTTTSSSRPPDQGARLSGAIIGILIFLAGIALIGYVFATARTLFDSPTPLIPASAFATPTPTPSALATALTTVGATASTAAAATSPAVAIISQNLAQFVQKLLLLLVMCIVGSAIASLGINLFFKALAAPRAPIETAPPSPPALTPPAD